MRRRARIAVAWASSALIIGAVAGASGQSARAGGAGASRTSVPAYNTIPVTGSGAGSLAGSSAHGMHGLSSTPVPGTNVNVSNRPGAQSETSVAIDPTNSMHMIASVNDLNTADTLTAQVYESTDGGATWTDTGAIPGGFCYDTWDEFGADGTAYVAYECLDQRIAIKPPGAPAWINLKLANAGVLPDRDMVIADTSASSPFSGSVYIGYDDNGNNNAAHVMYSRDGLVWQQSPTINDDTSAPTIGVNVSLASDGTLHAVWEDYSNRKIWIDTSTDGGATWGTDHLVSTYRMDTTGFFVSIPPQQNRGIVPFPVSAAVPAGAPHAGRIYVVYTDSNVAANDTDIFERYSDNGGITWSPEHRVNNDTGGAYQFEPTVSVAPNGLVAVTWYDTRNDPSNHKTDRYVATSKDGVRWRRNVKITTAQSDETAAADGNQYGDYQGSDIARGLLMASWTDSRPGTMVEDLFVAAVKP